MTLDEANALPDAAFVARFGGVFEHSPWVAQAVAGQRPFASVEALHAAMCAAVDAAGESAQLDLLRAHPDLAGRAALAGELTADSAREQDAAGLGSCSAVELAVLQHLNAAYRERFGFPFIVAVRGLDRAMILSRLDARLQHPAGEEFAEARRQVARIARLRLEAMIDPADAPPP
jgi:OHCU decarboxylase